MTTLQVVQEDSEIDDGLLGTFEAEAALGCPKQVGARMHGGSEVSLCSASPHYNVRI